MEACTQLKQELALCASSVPEWPVPQSTLPLWLHGHAFQVLHLIVMRSVLVQPQAYEEQLGQARAIQAQLQLCEEELEARTQDLTRYAAENRNLQVRPSSRQFHHTLQLRSWHKLGVSQWRRFCNVGCMTQQQVQHECR